MAVGFGAYIDGTSASSSTTAVVDFSARSAGELALVLISRYEVGTAEPTATPAGWTKLQSGASGSSIAWVYAKVLASGDLGTATWTWANARRTLATAAIYTGHDTSAPVADSAAGTFADGSTADCGSIVTDELMVVALCSAYSSSSKTYNALAGWTERRDNGSTTPDLWQLIADTDGAWDGGACAPDFTLSASADGVGGFVVAVKVAGGAPPAAGAIMTANRGYW